MATQIGPKDTAENRFIRFDFTKELATGEAITGTPTIAVSVVSGVDPSPTAMLSGSPVVASPFVSQRVLGGLANVTYKFRCIAQTDAGNTLVVAGALPVVTL